jgi:hypothetical protein
LTARKADELRASISFDGLRLERSYLDAREEAIDWLKSKSESLPTEVSFFLVREAYTATAIDYSVKLSDLTKLGGEAKFLDAIRGKLDAVEDKTTNELTLKKSNIEPPVRVCIKPESITISRSYGFAPGVQPAISYAFEPVTGRLQISNW